MQIPLFPCNWVWPGFGRRPQGELVLPSVLCHPSSVIRPMSSIADTYYSTATALLAQAREQNAPTLKKLGALAGQSVASGGVIHTFGSGHSEVIGREIIGRAMTATMNWIFWAMPLESESIRCLAQLEASSRSSHCSAAGRQS